MYRDVWELLGIEPTSNKKIIQQAYADKLKLYHPEEYPREFQQLQEAYRVASGYARDYKRISHSEETQEKVIYQSAERNAMVQPIWTPIDREEEQPKRKTFESDKKIDKEIWERIERKGLDEENEVKEPIPDYIVELGETDAQVVYEKDIAKYVKILEEKLIGIKREKDIKAVDALFADNRFLTVLCLDEFRVRFEKEMASHQAWNQKTLEVLLKNIQKMMNENTNHHLAGIKHFLELKFKKKENYGSEIAFVLVILFIIVSFVWAKHSQTDTYILEHSPQKEDICKLVQEQYGLIIEPENVHISGIRKDDNFKDGVDARTVMYKISYEEDNLERSFRGEYEWEENTGVVFDLENVLLRECAEKYLECQFTVTDFPVDMFMIFPQIKNQEEKEYFVKQLKLVLNDYFENPAIKKVAKDILIKISMSEIENDIYRINESNLIEECDRLSEELDVTLQLSLLYRLYEKGEYSTEEYIDKKWEIETQREK